VTRRHHFSERCMPLRQSPSEHPFSSLSKICEPGPEKGRVLPLLGEISRNGC
jgi:hypothetical protein